MHYRRNPWNTRADVARHNKKCSMYGPCWRLWLQVANKHYAATGDDAQAVIRANVAAKNWLVKHGKYRHNPVRNPAQLERSISAEELVDMMEELTWLGKHGKHGTQPATDWEKVARYAQQQTPGQEPFVLIRDIPLKILNSEHVPEYPNLIEQYAGLETPLPPIYVSYTGQEAAPTVKDGNHRVAAAHRRGQQTIDAVMTQASWERLQSDFVGRLRRNPRVKVEIELTKRDMAFLGSWASVGRAFDVIRTALTEPDNEQAWIIAMETIEDIAKPLNDMHQAVRGAIWANQCGQLIRPMHGLTNDIICRLPKDHDGNCMG